MGGRGSLGYAFHSSPAEMRALQGPFVGDRKMADILSHYFILFNHFTLFQSHQLFPHPNISNPLFTPMRNLAFTLMIPGKRDEHLLRAARSGSLCALPQCLQGFGRPLRNFGDNVELMRWQLGAGLGGNEAIGRVYSG